MAFDFRKLRGKIVEKYSTVSAFAQAFGVSKNTFSKKLNNQVKFSADDIIKIVDMLDIPENEINEYFFRQKV